MSRAAGVIRTAGANALGDETNAVAVLVSGVASIASAVFAVSAPQAWGAISDRPVLFVILLALTIALQLTSVEVYGRGTFSFAGSALLATGFTLGIGAAMVAALVAAAVNFAHRGGKLHRNLFTASTWALATAAGSAPYVLIGAGHATVAHQIACAVPAGPLYLIVNLGLLSVAMALAERTDARSIWRERFRWMTPYYFVSGPLAVILVIAYQRLGFAGLCAFALPPAFMTLSAKQYIGKTREAVEEMREKAREIELANEELAIRNADLHELFQFASGLAARAHDRAALAAYAESTLSRITNGAARLRIGRGSGGTPLFSGGSQVGSLSILDEGALDRDRWERLREAILPQLATAIEGANLVEQVRKTHLATIAALSRTIEAKDYYTGGHTERVAEIAVALAKRLGYEGSDLDAIEIGALLHDVGKIGVPESILHKKGTLDDEEWKVMKEHPIISDYILSEVDLPDMVRQIVRSSHERIDGDGYPDQLAGEHIPLPARIVFVADAFDALTTDRSYRPGRHTAAALEELRRNSGTQFCPKVIEALERLNREEPQLLHKTKLSPVKVA